MPALAAAALAAIAYYPSIANAYEVAVVPSSGSATDAALAALDEAVLSALADGGHSVKKAGDVAAALKKLGVATVGTQKEADKLGVSLGVTFVIVPGLTPFAGQDRIEILAYFLPDGRAEMLEQIAIEGETAIVVGDMIAKLITKQGLLGAAPAPEPVPEPKPAPEPEPTTEPTPEPGPAPGQPSDEDLLASLGEGGGDDGKGGGKTGEGGEGAKKKDRPSLADPFKFSAGLVGGWTVLLNAPASGSSAMRHGGHLGATLSCIVLPKIGLEVGGDIHVFFGPSGVGFSIEPDVAVHVGILPRLFLGARLGLGFFKAATGAQRSSMIMRIAPLLEVVLAKRAYLRFEIPAFSFLFFGDEDRPALAFLEMNVAVMIRF